jgi:L-iditol 2-dehydrogenase
MYHICDDLKVTGFQMPGAAQDYFAVSAAMALKVPDSLGIEEAAMIEPLSVAVHAVRRFGEVSGKKVAVLGAGTIGNLTAQAARALGAENVLITDVSEYRLQRARAVGLCSAVNPLREDLAAALLHAFGPDRADLILECVGSEQAMTDAVRCARKGSMIVVVGVFPKPALVNLGFVQDRELLIAGSLMYQRTDYEKAIELAASGAINFNELITHRFAFEEYQAAYEAIERAGGECMKVMIGLE